MVNRVLTPYMYEAMLAAQEGVAPAAIDRAAVEFGMPMGPIELVDVVGLDVAAHVGEIIARELGRTVTQIARLDELIAAKKLGRKSGAGFYSWQDGKPHKPPAAAPAPADLIDRMILVMVNECVACLREKVVDNADFADAGGDIRHRLRAVSWRTSHLRARARRAGGGRATARARGAPRRALPARCRLDAAHVMPGKCVTGSRCPWTPVLPSKQALRRSMSGRAGRTQPLVSNVRRAGRLSSIAPQLRAAGWHEAREPCRARQESHRAHPVGRARAVQRR